MPLCYIFAKATSPKVIVKPVTAVSRLKRLLCMNKGRELGLDALTKSAQLEVKAEALRYATRLMGERASPTSEHLFAALYGDYQYLLKFQYDALFDVACAVLRNRNKFKDYIFSTVTMLEYPDNERTPLRESRKLFATPTPRGIILLREKIEGGFGDKQAVKAAFKELQIDSCIDVFGPYDYVVEFPVNSRRKFNIAISRVEEVMKANAIQWTAMYCSPFKIEGEKARSG